METIRHVEAADGKLRDRFLDDIDAVSVDPKKQSFQEMVDALRTRYAPTQNVTMSHFNFHQKPGQSTIL